MKILFVCKRNEFRSPIAAAIASRIVGKDNVRSAGTHTRAPDGAEGLKLSDREHQIVFCRFMEDSGHKSFGKYRPIQVTETMMDWADIVVDMAEPLYDLDFVKNNTKTTRWEIENPRLRDVSFDEGYKKTEEIYRILEKNIGDLVSRASIS